MNEPRVVESVTNECQSLGRAHESSSARAEQLIACLEGEIAKRDARIVELEADLRGYRDGAKAEADAGDEARAECRQLRAKLAFFTGYGHDPHPSDKLIELALINFGGKWDGDRWAIEDADLHPFVRSFAAPVSEAKAQVVVMPERSNERNFTDLLTNYASGWNDCLDEVARLNAAPVQQVSVPDGWKLELGFDVLDKPFRFVDSKSHVPTIKFILPACEVDDTAAWDLRDKFARSITTMLAAAPAAPAADAGHVFYGMDGNHP